MGEELAGHPADRAVAEADLVPTVAVRGGRTIHHRYRRAIRQDADHGCGEVGSVAEVEGVGIDHQVIAGREVGGSDARRASRRRDPEYDDGKNDETGDKSDSAPP
jgi:hypothetical protein